jgi:hypothetical protein
MDMQEITLREEEAFYLYKEKYQQMHPPPQPNAVGGLGWQFFLLVLTSLFAVILAGLRTADQFYRAALLGGNQVLAYAEAVSVMFVVEGGIVVYSAIRSSTNKTISNARLGWGIGIMVLISTFAGLGQSLHLISNIDPTFQRYFEYGLSLVIGVGASALAWIGGEVLGSQIAKQGDKREQAQRAYEKEESAWQGEMLSSWSRSPERKIARGELMAELENSYRSPGNRRGNGNARGNARENLRNYGSDEVKTEIKEYIAKVFNKEGRVPGPTEVAEAVGTAKSYASRVTTEWTKEHSDAL